ncbi:MAG: GTP-binding protein, partial [Pseudomonadota bacterium]
IACADIILITKADLAGAANIAAAKSDIEKRSPRKVPILTIREGVVDTRVILGVQAAAEDDLGSRPSHHEHGHHEDAQHQNGHHHHHDDGHHDHNHHEDDHHHDDFASVVLQLDEVDTPEAIADAIQRLAREQNILRVKGYVAVRGKPMRLLVQAVGERVRWQFDKPWDEVVAAGGVRQSHLVFIGEHHHVDAAAIGRALATKTAAPTPVAVEA